MKSNWQKKIGGVLFAILTFEIGVALLVFPWLDHWAFNYFALITPESYREATWYEWWRRIWNSGYFRGAISGIGLLNLWVSIAALFSLRRFASRDPE